MALCKGKGVNDMSQDWYRKTPFNRKVYDLWHDLIRKVTADGWDHRNGKYKTWWTMDESWFTLSNFVRDIQTLPNYEYWRDCKFERVSLKPNQAHYSKDTCFFTSKAIKNNGGKAPTLM